MHTVTYLAAAHRLPVDPVAMLQESKISTSYLWVPLIAFLLDTLNLQLNVGYSSVGKQHGCRQITTYYLGDTCCLHLNPVICTQEYENIDYRNQKLRVNTLLSPCSRVRIMIPSTGFYHNVKPFAPVRLGACFPGPFPGMALWPSLMPYSLFR